MHAISRAVNGPIDAPNRNVTETKPSAHGHSSWMSSPAILTPPLIRFAATPPSGTAKTPLCVACSIERCADTSTCWPRPLTPRSRSASSAPTAASEHAWGNDCGTAVRTGGRSSSPVIASWHAAALTVRSVAGHAAFGPLDPNAVIETVTSAGSAARSAARSMGTAPLSITTSAPAHSRAKPSRPASDSRSSTTLRLPRFQPQNVSERSGSRPSPANGPRRRPPEPCGGSTSTTSAPSPASMNAARLPRSSVRSTTRYLSSIPQPYRSHRTARS